MSNFKNVEYCKCDDCVHNKICMYKQSLTNVFTKLMNDIGEDKFSDDAPFILKIDCQFKTTNNPIPKTAPIPVERQINQVVYQPNRVISEVDKVAQDPKVAISNMNTTYKEPIQAPSNNIRTIQNGVVTEEGKPKNKKLTTEEKVAMMKEYASNQYIPKGSGSLVNNESTISIDIPIQTSTKESINTEEK